MWLYIYHYVFHYYIYRERERLQACLIPRSLRWLWRPWWKIRKRRHGVLQRWPGDHGSFQPHWCSKVKHIVCLTCFFWIFYGQHRWFVDLLACNHLRMNHSFFWWDDFCWWCQLLVIAVGDVSHFDSQQSNCHLAI